MKVYQTKDNVTKEFDGFFDKTGTVIDKTMTVTSGDMAWKYVCGYRVGVDNDGMIIKGPDPLIGRNYEEICTLQPHEIFVIQQSIANATAAQSRHSDSEVGHNYSTENYKRISEYIDKALSKGK